MAIFWLYLLILATVAQVVHQWTRQRGGEGGDCALSLQVDDVGNAWVAGYTASSLDGHTNVGGRDIFLMKFDAQGVHLWTRQRGGQDDDMAKGLQVDAVGNAWVAGHTYSLLDGNTTTGRKDIFLMKFDAQGVHQWTRQRRGESSDFAHALQVDDVGNAWVAGCTYSSLDGNTNAGSDDVVLMKFDAQGVHLWTRQQGGKMSDMAYALQVDAVGNAWVAGYTTSSLDGHTNAGSWDIFLMKFDAQGVHLWTRQRGGEDFDYAHGLQVDVNGHAWVAGYTRSSLDGHSNAGGVDIFIMNFDGEGVHQWTHQRGGKGYDMAFAIQVDPTGNDAWVAGGTGSSLDGHSSAGSRDIFLMRFQAECSQVTCPAGYVQNPSWSNSTCCVRSSTPTSSWTKSTTASTSIATTTSSTKASTSITGTQSSTTASTRTSSRTLSTSTSTRSTTRASTSITRTKSTIRSSTSTASVTTASASASVEEALPAPPGLPVSQLEVEQQTSTTAALVDVENWEKLGISNAQSIDLGANTATTSSEHDSTGLLVAAVVLPLLTACLCASLGICCYRAKLRQLRGAEAEPQVPNPLAMLPPLAWSVKPLIFSWNSRMTAEWPRGKVQKLSVSETAFELSGRQFQFRPGQVQHFTWEDGTVQTVQSVQKNVVWWSTQHAHPAWQRFRWVCTPKCQIENHHDMELTDSADSGDGYRCTSCSRLRAGKHWYCPQHQVHVCPVCAELPPEMPTLGLAATYLVDVFPPLARRVTRAENPNFYDICPNLAHGSAGMGYNRTCPRDGRPHCSIVDALEDAYSGKVTHFVSWCWAYSLNDVVSAIERWVQKSNEDARNVFLWMCFFCNNQYRIQEEATQTGSDDLKEIFDQCAD